MKKLKILVCYFGLSLQGISSLLKKTGIFSQDIYYITLDDLPGNNILRLPLGSSVDMSQLIKKLPGNWYPDIFIAKVNAYFNLVPINVVDINCLKILVLGDTHHGFEPLRRMISYAHQEVYDLYVTDCDRHHLWYYWLSGLDNLYWLPTLFVIPPEQNYYQTPNINDQFFANKVTFIGSIGKYHPRRARLISALRDQIPNLLHINLPQQDSLKAFNCSSISLNISLNGDANMRNYEILSVGGFLLTDILSYESGLDIFLEAGRDLETFANLDELVEKINYFMTHQHLTETYRNNGYRKYQEFLSPERSLALLKDLYYGNPLPDQFTIKSIPRIQACPRENFSLARISLYEIIQGIHKVLETVVILVDGLAEFIYIEDFLDLPRVMIFIYNYTASEYLRRRNQYLDSYLSMANCRVIQLDDYQKLDCQVAIISQCDRITLGKLINKNCLIISNDYMGLEASTRYPESSSVTKSIQDFSGSFFVLDREMSLTDNWRQEEFIPWYPYEVIQTYQQKLQELNLRSINIIAFPNWQQADESLLDNIKEILKSTLTDLHVSEITVLIDCTGTDIERAELSISGALMQLLFIQSDLPVDQLQVSLITEDDPGFWYSLLKRVNYRFPYDPTSQTRLKLVGSLPVWMPHNTLPP